MKTFSLKTSKPGQTITKPHFHILNKGLNSGKPMQSPCPNCFVLITENETDKEFFFWLIYGLWQTKTFHPYLRGSVIPFIVISELKKIISSATEKAQTNHPTFTKTITSLQQLDLLEKQYHKNLELIKQAKMLLFYKYQR